MCVFVCVLGGDYYKFTTKFETMNSKQNNRLNIDYRSIAFRSPQVFSVSYGWQTIETWRTLHSKSESHDLSL